MKLLRLLLLLSFTVSCQTDDMYCTEEVSLEVNVIYDSQDNIIKVEDQQWIQSINLQTLEPSNEQFGILHDWSNRTIYVKSAIYRIVNVEVEELANYTTTSDNIADIYCPYMQEYMQNTDWFRLKFTVEIRASPDE